MTRRNFLVSLIGLLFCRPGARPPALKVLSAVRFDGTDQCISMWEKTDEWHHVFIYRTQDSQKVYIDGVLQGV